MLLEGGLDWKPLSMSPKDMDFVEAKNSAAREIALALGVPPMLLGIPGDNTYSNYQEASRSFWRQTVLPLVNRTAKALSGWLGPAYGGGLDLRPDLDQIEALAPEREALWTRLGKAEFLSDDEKRAAVGYGRKGEADVSAAAGGAKYNPYHDDRGRFTSGPGGGGAGDGGGDGVVQPVAFRPRGGGGKPSPPPPTSPPAAKPATGRDAPAEPQYRTPKSGLSGKEAASDIPSWARGERPLTSEDGKAYARRLMDQKYGAREHDTGPASEFNQLKKYGDRAFD